VATYSYQEEVFVRQMTVEDCLREMSDIGARHFELIAEMLVPDFPNPSSQWVNQMHHGSRLTQLRARIGKVGHQHLGDELEVPGTDVRHFAQAVFNRHLADEDLFLVRIGRHAATYLVLQLRSWSACALRCRKRQRGCGHRPCRGDTAHKFPA